MVWRCLVFQSNLELDYNDIGSFAKSIKTQEKVLLKLTKLEVFKVPFKTKN